MSLVALALRIATVKALVGRTLAGDRVYDSAIETIDAQVEEDGAPMIVVYTDEEEGRTQGKDLMVTGRSLSLVIQCAVANRVQAQNGAVSVEIPHTDEGIEAVLDFMRHDIVATLQTDQGDWADLWRELVTSVENISVRRGASVKKGLRFAAREITIKVDTLGEPQPGYTAGGPLDLMDALLRADPDLVDMADIIRSRIDPTATPPTWDKTIKALGLSRRGALAVGLGPIALGETPTPSTIMSIDLPAGGTIGVEPESP
jgi:hypothetical protein